MFDCIELQVADRSSFLRSEYYEYLQIIIQVRKEVLVAFEQRYSRGKGGTLECSCDIFSQNIGYLVSKCYRVRIKVENLLPKSISFRLAR